MRILVVGSGAREHAILWKLSQSDAKHELFVCPGNVGMDEVAQRLPVQDGNSIEGYARLAADHKIDLTVVGPEGYLVDGIADLFHQRKLRIFGPTAEAARLEGSKVWAKDVMQAVGIPTASWRSFSDNRAARRRAEELDWLCVIKADGLAAGKGAYVCRSEKDVNVALRELVRMSKPSSSVLLVEELLEGQELSVFAITDGRTVLPFGAAQDHKRLRDGDEGPNTGGMGAYSPVDHMLVAQNFADGLFQPLVRRLQAHGVEYVGVLYAGAIVTSEGPKILEFNCRFGDPETEVLLSRLDSDLASLLIAATDGLLHTVPKPKWSSQEALCVVASGRNYPREGDFGSSITGIDAAERAPGVIVFHAGTEGDPGTGQITTNGGRILCVTATGANLSAARDRAYEALSEIDFDGMYYRTDIGAKALSSPWQARLRKSPRWEQQMRAVTDGLDALASAVRRLQLRDDIADTHTVQDLQDIRQRLYDLKLQTILPGEVGAGAGLRLTWNLLARYAEVLTDVSPAISSSNDRSAESGLALERTPSDHDAELGSASAHSARPRLDVLRLPLDSSILRFERHENYDMLVWNCKLTAAETIEWLEKQRDTAGAFYVDTKFFAYEFDDADADIVSAIGRKEPISAIRSIRLETSSYTCIWSSGDSEFQEEDTHFAILSPALLVDDVWWFMKGTIEEADAEAFMRVLQELQELAGDAPHRAQVK